MAELSVFSKLRIETNSFTTNRGLYPHDRSYLKLTSMTVAQIEKHRLTLNEGSIGCTVN